MGDHSRYLIGLRACACERTETVQGHLEELFRTHGLPECILCDNGSPWSGPGGDHTALSVWLMLLGVRVCHGRPFHPQTQGKDERFHRTLKADLLARRDFATLAQTQPHFDAYRHLYNHDRPHQALGDAVPASRYTPSLRAWRPVDPHFDYAPEYIQRTVKSKGEITFQNRFFYLGQAFCRHAVALEPTALSRALPRAFSRPLHWPDRPACAQLKSQRQLLSHGQTHLNPVAHKLLPMSPATCYPCVRSIHGEPSLPRVTKPLRGTTAGRSVVNGQRVPRHEVLRLRSRTRSAANEPPAVGTTPPGRDRWFDLVRWLSPPASACWKP